MGDTTLWRSSGAPHIDLELRTLSAQGRTWQQPVLVQSRGLAGAVVCASKDDALLMVLADRPLVGREVLELPRGWTDPSDALDGGGRDDQEWALRTATRECLEETGTQLAEAAFVGWLWADPGILGSRVGVVRARLSDVDTSTFPDGPEGRALLVGRGDLRRAVADQRVCDGITLAALTMCGVFWDAEGPFPATD